MMKYSITNAYEITLKRFEEYIGDYEKIFKRDEEIKRIRDKKKARRLKRKARGPRK